VIWVGEKEAAVRIPSLVRVGVKTGKVLSVFLVCHAKYHVPGLR